MLSYRPLRTASVAAILLAVVLAQPTPAAAQAEGATCPTNGYTAAATAATGGQNLICSSGDWAYVPYQFGNSTATCGSTVAGTVRWTGSAFQGCNGSTWGSLATSSSAPLSSLISATTTNSFDNSNFAQTWTWNSLSTQTAFTISSSSALTGGTLLSLQATSASATSTGDVLSISDSTTGTGYGVYASMTATGNTGTAIYATNSGATNTGYAGYFNNTATTGWSLYAPGAAPSYFAGQVDIGTTSPTTGGAGAATLDVYASNNTIAKVETPAGSTAGPMLALTNNATNGVEWNIISDGPSNGPGVGQLEFYNRSASVTRMVIMGANGNVGIGTAAPAAQLQVLNSSTTGYGIYSSITGAANTGYAGYFTNTATSGINYGLYASTSSSNSSAYAAYFQGNIYINGTMTLSSDRRLKKDIWSIDPESALDEIAALRPVTFTWRKNGQPDSGLIAQEVEAVFPALVKRDDNHQLAIEYNSLIAPMIASIQELKKRDEAEQEEIEDLTAANDNLRQEMEALKAQLDQ